MVFHRDETDVDIHVGNARTFADITARDGDTSFQITENINKEVRVDSPLSYFKLASIGPAVWVQTAALASISIFGGAFVNDNLIANGAIVNNIFTDMVFGTAGVALVEYSNVEGWVLFDELNGTFEYTGTDAFIGIINWDFSVVSSGGTLEYKFKWQKDIGAGFVDLTDNVEAIVDVASITRNVSKTQPLTAVTGDKIKSQITRLSGSSGITIRYATINVSQ